jgi:cell division protein FtsQ
MRDEVLPMPLDVKLMNATASVLFTVVALLALSGASLWVLRHPWFSIAGITVRGDVTHHSPATLRASVAPRLSGNFFTLSLDDARQAFEGVPWVRKAVIWREFPNRLLVRLEEHQPVAFWGGEGDSRMLNNFGEVFDTTGIDLDQDELPRFIGPQGQPMQMLEMYRALFPLLQPMEANLDTLELTERGSWRVELSNDTVIELGRGTQAEVLERMRRFIHTVTPAIAQYNRTPAAIESADLRHGNGYALRLRGVTTVTADAAKASAAKAVAKAAAKPTAKPATRPPGVNR